MLIQHSVNYDWLTQSRVLYADWFILGIDEKATFNIKTHYYLKNMIINLLPRILITHLRIYINFQIVTTV